jgi:hypothetical protein
LKIVFLGITADGKQGVIMDDSERCRIQANECDRLMLLSRSGAEATILTSLRHSWQVIANQTDRYVAIMKKEAAQKAAVGFPKSMPSGSARGSRSIKRPERDRSPGAGHSRQLLHHATFNSDSG